MLDPGSPWRSSSHTTLPEEVAMADPKIYYKWDIAGTNELMNAPEMVAMLLAAAEKGGRYAAGIAPRRIESDDHYADAFEVETSTHAGPAHDRAEARLVNTSDHATEVEWLDNGGHRVLGRTVDYIETHGADG
jgi:hypothetical protein